MQFYINETADMGYSPYNILLNDTKELNALADSIQKKKGEIPLFDYSGEYDDDNWYDFYLECNIDGVKGMYFTYGVGDKYGDEIKLTEQDKKDAFKAVCDFYGSIEDYKEYVAKYGDY